MKASKRFDCVQMKNDIQAQLLKEYAGLTDAEQMDSMRKELSASDAPAAKFWRRIYILRAEGSHLDRAKRSSGKEEFIGNDR